VSTPYLGQIMMCSFAFAPKGFALCNGQLLSIQQNTALFSVLGTFYGGNGVQTFGLPNLQGRAPVHQGQGIGLSPYSIGQAGGTETVTINQNTMPQHTHTLNATQTTATSSVISTGVLPGVPTVSEAPASPEFYANQGPVPLTPNLLAGGVCSAAGGSQPHSNLMPSLTINFVIALAGIFPSRN
jgi:microcystin-dependent protein